MNDIDFLKYFPYKQARIYQRDIIEKCIQLFESGKKYILLNAPTGIGKSVLGYTIASYFSNSYILTSQKILQQQYVNDFKSTPTGIGNIKGRSNYTCRRNSNFTCHMGVCSSSKNAFPCKSCPYIEARNYAFSHAITLTNYSYFFAMCEINNDGQEFIKPRDLLILDECHNTENELIDYISLALDKQIFKDMRIKQDIPLPDNSLSDTEKVDFLFEEIQPVIEKILTEEKEYLETLMPSDNDYIRQNKKCSFLDRTNCAINILNKNYNSHLKIIVIQDKDKISYKPLYCKYFANDYIFNKAEKVLMMSATIISKEQYCKDMGLNPDDVVYIKCPAVFPKENRPIYNFSIGSMAYKDKEDTKPKLLRAVKDILAHHEGERGIIHTVSYDIAQYLIDNIDCDRFIMPKDKDRDRLIEYFITSDKPDLVLISPSLAEGIDLKGDLSRFSVICKVPFGNLGDKWIKSRMEVDQNWYIESAIKTLIQMCGRSVRTETDYAKTYILDSSFNYFYNNNIKKFPEWWKESLHKRKIEEVLT